MHNILEKYHFNLSLAQEKMIFDSSSNCISLKNNQGIYHYANPFFVQLMGRHHLRQVISKRDKDLTSNLKLLTTIAEHDCQIIDEEQAFAVQEVIYPVAIPWLKKEVRGHLYPVFSATQSRPVGILGVFQPVNKLLTISLEAIARLSLNDFRQLLVKTSYSISWQGLQLRLSRQEILVIIATVKGWQAGDIAAVLKIAQVTVESYLRNIKNKLGLQTRRDIIAAVLETGLLEPVFI